MHLGETLDRWVWMQDKDGPWSTVCSSKLYETKVCSVSPLYPPRSRIHLLHDVLLWEVNLQGLQQWLHWPFLFQLWEWGIPTRIQRNKREWIPFCEGSQGNMWLHLYKGYSSCQASVNSSLSLSEQQLCVMHQVVIVHFCFCRILYPPLLDSKMLPTEL